MLSSVYFNVKMKTKKETLIMDYINSDELLDLLSAKRLTRDELEKVAAGYNMDCINQCYNDARLSKDGEALQKCLMACIE